MSAVRSRPRAPFQSPQMGAFVYHAVRSNRPTRTRGGVGDEVNNPGDCLLSTRRKYQRGAQAIAPGGTPRFPVTEAKLASRKGELYGARPIPSPSTISKPPNGGFCVLCGGIEPSDTKQTAHILFERRFTPIYEVKLLGLLLFLRIVCCGIVIWL